MQNVRTVFPSNSILLLILCIGIPCVTDCVLAELEKLGHRYRVALRFVIFHIFSLQALILL
jgi:rRNA-processing protein FCF1